MQIVVTGGNGFVGRAVVREMLGHGHLPRLLRRHRDGTTRPSRGAKASVARPDPYRVDVRSLDFRDSDALADACRDAEAIVHLPGIISECGENTFEAVHVGLTRAMVEAARTAGVRRFVHMSALGTRKDARSRYHATKWAAEEILRASGLEWTIFRPSLIYGPEDGFTRLFDRLAGFSPVLPAIGGGHGLLQPIAVEQVARAFVGAVGVPSAVGRTYDLCGPDRLSFREVLRDILAATSRRRAIVTLPWRVAGLQARFLEAVWPRLLRRAPPLNRDQILMLQEDNVGDGGPADHDFGLVHVPFREAMRRQFGPAWP